MRLCGKYGAARQATGDSIIRCGRFACCVTKARDTVHCLFCLLKSQLHVITYSIYRRYFVPLFTSTVELHLPEPWLSGWLIIGIGFALRVDLSRILQSYFP